MAPDGKLKHPGQLIRALTDYAKLLDPWAKAVASMMIADVARRDKSMWLTNAKTMGAHLRDAVTKSAVSAPLTAIQDEQVVLIKSLPLKAAERVHELSLQSMLASTRAKEIESEILKTGDITAARARTTARTEVSRVASNLVQVRSQAAGSDGYIWRTSGDADVRDSHAEMEGKYVRWDSPPTLDKLKGHAGTLPNCRCFAEPVFPDD